MSEHPLDSRDLLRRARAQLAANAWAPLPPEDLDATLDPMRSHTEIASLHDRWASVPDRFGRADAGRGARRLVLWPVGRLVFRVLARYTSAERELLAQLVRANDALASRCDELTRVIARRQALEAQNQAKLAASLGSGTGPGGPGDPPSA